MNTNIYIGLEPNMYYSSLTTKYNLERNIMRDIHKEKNPNWKGGGYIICLYCETDVWKYPNSNTKFCSSKCSGLFRKGTILSQQTKDKIRNSLKGRIPWNKGISYTPYFTEEVKQRMRQNQLGENNSFWKGNKVGYKGIHSWIRRNKPKPEFCEECGKRPPYDCHNISGKYTRDFDDWKYVCRICHRARDRRKK